MLIFLDRIVEVDGLKKGQHIEICEQFLRPSTSKEAVRQEEKHWRSEHFNAVLALHYDTAKMRTFQSFVLLAASRVELKSSSLNGDE